MSSRKKLSFALPDLPKDFGRLDCEVYLGTGGDVPCFIEQASELACREIKREHNGAHNMRYKKERRYISDFFEELLKEVKRYPSKNIYDSIERARIVTNRRYSLRRSRRKALTLICLHAINTLYNSVKERRVPC